jgi:hypothetical protein
VRKKFFQDQGVGESRQPLARGRKTPQVLVGPAVWTADGARLLADILALCGDRQNEAAYRKAIKEHSASLISMVLAETRQAANEGRIGKTRGAFFFDTLQRLAALRTP